MKNDSAKKLLMVEITFPGELAADALALGFPSGNVVGSVLLNHYLAAHFHLAGLTGNEIAHAGEFNNAALTITTGQVAETLAVLRSALAPFGLLAFVRVYQYDFAELILRCLYPEGGAPISINGFPDGFQQRVETGGARALAAATLARDIAARAQK